MTTKILRCAMAALLAAAAPAPAQQYRIEYTIAVPEPASHLYAITLFVSGFTGRTVDLQMPVWSPGRRPFHFPHYDLRVDTPTEVAPSGSLLLDSFAVDNRFYRVMVHHNGDIPPGTRERFVRDVESIVRYENSVFGPPPLEQYTFL